MKEFTYVITDPEGIHARPAGLLVKAAAGFKSDIKIEKDGKAAARAVAAVYGKGFYMGNYLKITYSWPDGAQEEGVTDHILATVALYSDADYQDPIAEDSEVLEFRHKIACKTDITAIAQKD